MCFKVLKVTLKTLKVNMEDLSMDSTTLTRQMKLQQWTELIHTRIESGLTVAQWCEQNSINPAKYYYWLKRVRQNTCDHLPAVKSQTANIVAVDLEEPILENAYESEKSYVMRTSVNGIILEFTNDASTDLIHNSLKVFNYVR